MGVVQWLDRQETPDALGRANDTPEWTPKPNAKAVTLAGYKPYMRDPQQLYQVYRV